MDEGVVPVTLLSDGIGEASLATAFDADGFRSPVFEDLVEILDGLFRLLLRQFGVQDEDGLVKRGSCVHQISLWLVARRGEQGGAPRGGYVVVTFPPMGVSARLRRSSSLSTATSIIL